MAALTPLVKNILSDSSLCRNAYLFYSQEGIFTSQISLCANIRKLTLWRAVHVAQRPYSWTWSISIFLLHPPPSLWLDNEQVLANNKTAYELSANHIAEGGTCETTFWEFSYGLHDCNVTQHALCACVECCSTILIDWKSKKLPLWSVWKLLLV